MTDPPRSNQPHDQELDITGDRCPMTFVRVRLALDRLQSGQVLRVHLRGDEPIRNVPLTAVAQGHALLACIPGADGVSQLLIRKG